MSDGMSLKAQEGETPEDVLDRVVKTARLSLGLDTISERIEFSFYVRSNYTRSEMLEVLAERTGIAEEVLEHNKESIGFPFGEIELACVLDTSNWAIEILGIKST